MRSYIASKPSAFSFPPIRTDDLDQTFFSGAPHSVGSLDSIQNEAIRKLTLPLHGTTLIRGQVGGFPLRQLFAVASKSRASTETEKPHGGDFERRCVMLTDDATVVLKNMKTLDPLPLLRTSEFKSVSVLTVQRLRRELCENRRRTRLRNQAWRNVPPNPRAKRPPVRSTDGPQAERGPVKCNNRREGACGNEQG